MRLEYTTPPKKSRQTAGASHIYGFDYARAIASILVLLWHIHAFGVSDLFSINVPSTYIPTWSDVVNINILLQAVPFFIFLSCYLFASRPAGQTNLKGRIIRIGSLHLFWPITYLLFTGGVTAVIAAAHTFPERPLYGVITGLGTYYFFSALLLTILLTALARSFENPALIAWAILAAALITAFQWATVHYKIMWPTAFWNPLNYIIMPPVAVLLSRYIAAAISTRKLALSLAFIWSICAALEWAFLVNPAFFPGQGYSIPAYTRISPALFSCTAIIFFVGISRKPGRVINFLSTYALTQYCLQPFVLPYISKLGISKISQIIVALAVIYPAAVVLRKFIFRERLIV